MSEEYQNEIAQAIAEAAHVLSSRVDKFGFEYLASAEVGEFLRAAPRLAESFESIASSLDRIADAIERDDAGLEALAGNLGAVADAIEKLKP